MLNRIQLQQNFLENELSRALGWRSIQGESLARQARELYSTLQEIEMPSLARLEQMVREDIEQFGPHLLGALGERVAANFAYSVYSDARDPIAPLRIELKNYPRNGVILHLRRFFSMQLLISLETNENVRQYTYAVLEQMQQQLRQELVELGLRAMRGESLIITHEETFHG